VNYKQIDNNISTRKEVVKYIVIHDTGNISKGATSEMHFRYFTSALRDASADFFVDSNGVLKVNNYTKFCTWHCGDGSGRYGITNQNSIGIEMCVNADGDYGLTLKNTIELVKQLKKEFPSVQIVRHYDASRKNCPASLNYNNWEGWTKFLKELEVVELTWKEIIKKVASNPAEWEAGINTAVAAAKADGNLGALEIFQYLPTLIEKIYNSK
jgi:N-acetylmuramoyl-L-alanine amidase CwlA